MVQDFGVEHLVRQDTDAGGGGAEVYVLLQAEPAEKAVHEPLKVCRKVVYCRYIYSILHNKRPPFHYILCAQHRLRQKFAACVRDLEVIINTV